MLYIKSSILLLCYNKSREGGILTLEYSIRLLAGFLMLTSLTLGYFVHNGWLFLGAFVGVNLIQSVFTKWCLAESLLKKYIYTEGKNN